MVNKDIMSLPKSLFYILLGNAIAYYAWIWPALKYFSIQKRIDIERYALIDLFAVIPGLSLFAYYSTFVEASKNNEWVLLESFRWQKYGIWIVLAIAFCTWVVLLFNKYESNNQKNIFEQNKNDIEQHKDDIELGKIRKTREMQVANGKAQLEVYKSASASTFTEVTSSLVQAQKHLDIAEKLFVDRYYIPYWDEIEKTICNLGCVDEGILKIQHYSKEHANMAFLIGATKSRFPVTSDDIDKLKNSKSVSNRMNALVMKAQGDYEFSNVYLGIRTNQIMVSGFKTLSEGVERMGDKISTSIHDLEQALRDVSESTLTTFDQINNSVTSIASDSTEIRSSTNEMENNSKSLRQEIEKANEKLDNIQWNHKPSDLGLKV